MTDYMPIRMATKMFPWTGLQEHVVSHKEVEPVSSPMNLGKAMWLFRIVGYYVTFRNRSETRIQVMPGSLRLTMWPLKASCYTVRKTSKLHRKDPEERNGPQLSSLSIWIAMLLAIWGSHPATGLSALSWCVLRDTEQNWGKVSCLSLARITNIVLLSLLLILVDRYPNWQPAQKGSLVHQPMTSDNSLAGDSKGQSCLFSHAPITLSRKKFCLGCIMNPLIVSVVPTVLFLEYTILGW